MSAIAEKLLKDKNCRLVFDIESKTNEGAHIITEVLLAVEKDIVELSEFLVQKKYLLKEYLGRLGEGEVCTIPKHPVQHLPQTAIDVSISFTNTPHDFYLNIMEDWSSVPLPDMIIQLNKQVQLQKPYAPTNVGEYVAAQFEAIWYGARV